MPAFKRCLLKGPNTFLTFRCPPVISMRQFKRNKERKFIAPCYRGWHGVLLYMKLSFGSQPGRPISTLSQWLSIFVTNSDHPTVHLAVVNAGEEEKWPKTTMLTHNHATVHLFICASVWSKWSRRNFPKADSSQKINSLVNLFGYIAPLIKLFHRQSYFMIRESVYLPLVLLSHQSLGNPSVSWSITLYTRSSRKIKFPGE